MQMRKNLSSFSAELENECDEINQKSDGKKC